MLQSDGDVQEGRFVEMKPNPLLTHLLKQLYSNHGLTGVSTIWPARQSVAPVTGGIGLGAWEVK